MPTLMEYQSPTDSLQSSTFGHLQVHLRKYFQVEPVIVTSVLALTPDATGHTPLLPGWATITSVTVATLDPATLTTELIVVIPSGMDRDVHPPVPAVSLITLHGSVNNCHKPWQTVSKSGYVAIILLPRKVKTYWSN